MNRLACHRLLLTTLLSLPLACGDDSATGSGTESETETGTGGSGSTTANETNTSTTTTTTAGTMGGTGSTTEAPTTTGVDSSGGSEVTGEPGTTTTGNGAACEDCVATECTDQLAACLDNPDCACWVDCINAGNGGMECGMMCGGPPPGEFGDLNNCTENNCAVECAGDGETYDPCNGDLDCSAGLQCSGFLDYCSPDCMGDDMNCPMPATGDAVPICGGMNDNLCILPCGNGETCPDGMMCAGGGGNQRCVPN